MRASRYNRIFRTGDGTWLAFNSWSTALAELTPGDVPFVKALLADPDGTRCDSPHKREIREALVRGRFLLVEGEDELAVLKMEMLKDRFRTDVLGLTIAPTLDCNFRCDYCYEDHFRVTMSRAVQQALLRWVEDRAGRIEKLHVTWFGGEPLLPTAFPVVEGLSESFQELARGRDFAYEAEIVTNGYLLSRAKVERLRDLGVGKLQVTLDGPAAIHDTRRFLAGGQGTFDRIVANVREIVDRITVQLRINVDRRNAEATLDLMELLQREGIAEKVQPYLAQVTFDGAACGNILESCYSSEEFARTELGLYREAARRGLPLSRYPWRIKGAFCTADRAFGYVVTPSGALFKCWNEVTVGADRAIGHLLDGDQPFHGANEAHWLAWDPLEKADCPSCDVLPLCHGGCPLEAMKDPDRPHGACEHYKFNLEPLLEIQHLHRPRRAAAGPPPRGGIGGES